MAEQRVWREDADWLAVKANERWVGVVAFGRSEQDGEAFLLEMVVVGQDFGYRFLAHDQHGNAVGQAVFLVRAGFVECKTVKNDWDDCGCTVMAGSVRICLTKAATVCRTWRPCSQK